MNTDVLQELLLPSLAIAALLAVMVPIVRWQAFLFGIVSMTLRLLGLIAIAVGAALYFQWLSMPNELAQFLRSMLGASGPTQLFLVVLLVELLLILFSMALDSTRRLLGTSWQVEQLVAEQQSMTALLRELLDRVDSPGANVSPQRRRELETALSQANQVAPSTRSPAAGLRASAPPRKTLGQLMR